jgi:hypothetical protein
MLLNVTVLFLQQINEAVTKFLSTFVMYQYTHVEIRNGVTFFREIKLKGIAS